MKKTITAAILMAFSFSSMAKPAPIAPAHSSDITPYTNTKPNNRITVGRGTMVVASGEEDKSFTIHPTQYCNPTIYTPTVTLSVARMGYQKIPTGDKAYFRACYMGTASVSNSNAYFDANNNINFSVNATSKNATVNDSHRACGRFFWICTGRSKNTETLDCGSRNLPVTLNYTITCVPK